MASGCKVTVSGTLGGISPRPLALFPAPQLRRLRLDRLLSVDKLAGEALVARSSIMALEHGGVARAETIRKLAKALDVEPSELMRQPPEA